MQVSQRHTGIFGIQYATTPTGTKLLNTQGKDAVGNKYLTAGQRAATMQDGYQKASGLGNKINDSIHRGQAAAANQRAQQTYAGAAANGNITKLEQRNINSANRDAGVANKQVQVDNARTHLGNVKVAAARDGKITPGEQTNINHAQGNLNRLGGELNRMKQNDARMDRSDARQNTVGNQIRSSIQDAVGVGRKVAPTWAGPAAGIARPAVTPHHGCVMHHGGHTGASSGRLSQHVAHDHGKLRLTNSAGFAGGTQYLSAGQRHTNMAQGAAKGNYGLSDHIHKNQANQANANLRNTYASAGADGRIGMFENRNINDAKRNAGVANQQVAVDTQRRHVGHLEQRYSADGKITMGERHHLNTARGKLSSMTNELNNLKAKDASADRADASFKANPFNRFANAIGIGSRPAVGGLLGGIAQTAAQGAAGLAQAASNFAQNFRPMPLPMPMLPRPPLGGLLGGIGAAIGGAIGSIGGAMAGIAGAMVPPPPLSLCRPALLSGASFSASTNSSFNAVGGSYSSSSSSNSSFNAFGGSYSSSSSSTSSSSSSWGLHGSASSSMSGSASFGVGAFRNTVSWNSNVSMRY